MPTPKPPVEGWDLIFIPLQMFDINEQVDNLINVPRIAQIAHRKRVVLSRRWKLRTEFQCQQ